MNTIDVYIIGHFFFSQLQSILAYNQIRSAIPLRLQSIFEDCNDERCGYFR